MGRKKRGNGKLYILISFINSALFIKTIQMIKLRKKNARTMQKRGGYRISRRFICKSPLSNPMRRWKNNYKKDHTERKCCGLDVFGWNKAQYWAAVRMAMNLEVS